MNNNCIDFVITWVDSSDPEWFEEFAKYKYGDNADTKSLFDINAVRYRDWGLLKYWFRGVDKFAPWVRCIHFITYGHIPSWLNINNPKLKIVRHEDYIPKQYLPVFNSNPIELMIHRIPDLSERFVYFNDDFFLVKPILPEYFFYKSKPCEMACVKNHHSMDGIMLGITKNNMKIINNEFDIFSSIFKHPSLWFYPHYKGFLKLTIKALLTHNIVSLLDTHAPTPYLKSTFVDVWNKYGEQLERTMSHRFRSSDDTNHWVFRYWQILRGDIFHKNIYDSTGIFYNVEQELNTILNSIRRKKYSVMVLNDSESVEDFDLVKNKLNKVFEELLPDKSSFEK